MIEFILNHKITQKLQRLSVIIFIDIQLMAFSYLFSFLLRFDFQISDEHLKTILYTFPIVILIKLAHYLYFNLNRIIWRYTGLPELIKIIFVSTVNNIVYGFVIFFFLGFESFPRSILILDWMGYIMSMGGIRLSYRYLMQKTITIQNPKKTLIIGAESTAESLIREMLTRRIERLPVGILDDNPKNFNRYIHGVKVYGPIKDVHQIARMLNVEEIIIAIPSATHDQMKRIVRYCESCVDLKIKYKTVPSLNEILTGKTSPTTIREIKLEDLINRKLVTVDQIKMRAEFKDKVVMITGAAGSIGSELAKQISKCQPSLLILIDRNENNFMYLEHELQRSVPSLGYTSIISDCMDKGKMEEIIQKYKPFYLFHTSAYKHVPYMENNPTEAINNNVLATYNLAKIAERNGIYKFVYISTDKAVNPTSVMGCSKRIAELSLLNLFKTSTTRYITVRFGNVIGSQGSVVEIFKRQIKLGGPLTVTHPKMKRFFMTISEAVRLTLYAGYIGRHGDILILDMGEQIPILTVAENMIRLAGYDPYLDINILFTGIRPGEKLCEELWNSYEIAIPTDHPKINKTIYNETENEFDESSFFELLDLGKNHGDEKQIKFILKKLVPSYNLVVEEPIQKVNRVMK